MKNIFKAVFCVLFAAMFFSCASTDAETEEKSLLFPVEDVDSVSISLYRSTVEVQLWNKNEIFVIAESQNGEFPVCYINGTTLLCKIERGKESNWGKLRVFVPESFYAQEWRISTVSGPIYVEQLWCDNCEIETTSGSIKLDKCEVRCLDVTSTSGRILANDLVCSGISDFTSTSGAVNISGFLPQTDVTTASGAITVENFCPFVQNSSMSSLSGAIKLSMPENNGYELSFSSLSGQVYDEFTSFKGKGSGTTSYKNGGVKIEAETLSGAIRIKKNN